LNFLKKCLIYIVFSVSLLRFGLGCSLFKDEIWTAGGSTDGLEKLDVVEVLSLVTNNWRSGPTLTRGRYFLTMEVLDSSLVVFGGLGGEDSLETLNGEEWREEPLQYQHDGHASVSVQCN
jgi:hypothetical protein